MKIVLFIAYWMSGHVIDRDIIEAANMEECQVTKQLALSENTPITTRYGSNVKISAECKQTSDIDELNTYQSARQR